MKKTECLTWRKAVKCIRAAEQYTCIWVPLGSTFEISVLTCTIYVMFYGSRACLQATIKFVHMYIFSYPWDELSNHAAPCSIGSRNPIHSVPHQPDAILKLENISQFFQHVHTEAFIAVISLQFLVVLPQHHIRILLKSTHDLHCWHYISKWLFIKCDKSKRSTKKILTHYMMFSWLRFSPLSQSYSACEIAGYRVWKKWTVTTLHWFWQLKKYIPLYIYLGS